MIKLNKTFFGNYFNLSKKSDNLLLCENDKIGLSHKHLKQKNSHRPKTLRLVNGDKFKIASNPRSSERS